MRDKADGYYDLAIVDPPYGIGWAGENLTMSKGLRKNGTIRDGKSWRAKNYEQKYESKKWDEGAPTEIYFKELFRITKKRIIWGGNYFHMFLKPSGGWIIWDKKKPPEFSLSEGEMAWTDIKNSLKIFRYLWHGYGQEKMGRNKEVKIHPTQKPVALYKWLLKNYAKPGDKLLDTHSGSGSFRIAAYDMGFDLDSCEIDEDYFRDNNTRFENHIKQADLFKPEERQKNIYSQPGLL